MGSDSGNLRIRGAPVCSQVVAKFAPVQPRPRRSSPDEPEGGVAGQTQFFGKNSRNSCTGLDGWCPRLARFYLDEEADPSRAGLPSPVVGNSQLGNQSGRGIPGGLYSETTVSNIAEQRKRLVAQAAGARQHPPSPPRTSARGSELTLPLRPCLSFGRWAASDPPDEVLLLGYMALLETPPLLLI